MTTLVCTRRPLRRRLSMLEAIERIDRAAKILRGVKVLGLESKNGRRYELAALKDAARLYEGKSVRLNHPKKATAQRGVEEGLGWLKDVQLRPDGLYADLHYLETHPFSAQLLETAERNPSALGLSHNADGDTRREGDTEVVYRICEVRSVDLVLDPATTQGLWESFRRHRMKLKAFMEALKLRPKARATVKRLFEDEMLDPEMSMDDAPPPPAADAGPEDHEAALRTGFEGACVSIIQKALDGEMDMKDALKKVKEILDSHKKLTGKDEPVTPAEPPAEETDEDGGEEEVEESDEEEEEIKEECDEDLKEDCDEDKDKMKESRDLKRENARLKARESARTLCESMNITPGKALLEALTTLPSDRARRELLEETKGGLSRPRTVTTRTRGAAATSNANGTRDMDAKSFASALKGGRFGGDA